MPNNVVHLSSGFMLTSIMGGIISAIYVYPKSASFGFTFFLFFTLMFVASLISMTYAPLEHDIGIKEEKSKKAMK